MYDYSFGFYALVKGVSKESVITDTIGLRLMELHRFFSEKSDFIFLVM